jgi:Ca-activated chloride channel family protein
MSRRSYSGSTGAGAKRQNVVIPAAVVGLLAMCCVVSLVVWLVSRQGSRQTSQPAAIDPRNAVVTLAYSPEKATLVEALAKEFNAKKLKTTDGQSMQIELVEMTPEEMVAQALAGEPSFQALTPDSSLWLDQLNRQWAESQAAAEPGAIEPRLTGEPVRYAVTPIVIAAWEDSARALGWPDQPVGWTTIQTRAQQDSDFRWSHPSTAYASGLLATLAEFYAGAGVQRGLTAELAQDPRTLEFVSNVEKTVKYYGEGEITAIQRAVKEGPGSLDAFVVSEQLLTAFNTGAFGAPPAKLVALYPAEGTLWADHPLALLETAAITPNQRRTFQSLREFLATPEVQKKVLQAGYRPADLSIPLDSPGSPLTAANGVNPGEPQTTLQLPASDVVSVVRNAWALTKRKANVFLVADTSGSMEGAKLNNAQTALRAFLTQIPTDQERVGLVEFNSDVVNVIELDTLGNNRATLVSEIDNLEAGGNTALLDAIRTAYVRLQRRADPERINAIVAMTDGKENASMISLRALAQEIQRGNQDLPVVIFAVAYGGDADYEVLQALADASGGEVRAGTPETIRDLYKILSTYF